MAIIRIPGEMDLNIMNYKLSLQKQNRRLEPVFSSSKPRAYSEKEEEIERPTRERVVDNEAFHRELEEAYHRLSHR